MVERASDSESGDSGVTQLTPSGLAGFFFLALLSFLSLLHSEPPHFIFLLFPKSPPLFLNFSLDCCLYAWYIDTTYSKHMNKTIYIRDEDVGIWDRARELSGDKLSPVIVAALKRFVAEREAQPRGYERIVVEFNDSLDNYLPKAKAFLGRWIISREDPLIEQDGSERTAYAVAETAKGAVVVFRLDEDAYGGEFAKLLTYPSMESAARDSRANYGVREAVKRRGVPVEELDI